MRHYGALDVIIQRKIKGFSLVELMVSISLGLLIIAVAFQIFLTGQMGIAIQKSMADIQENGNFGLRFLSSELRKTNYGQSGLIHDRSEHGGIVFTTLTTPLLPAGFHYNSGANNVTLNVPRSIGQIFEIPISKSGLISNVQVIGSSTGLNGSSDQLVIQYYADQNGIDCEGNTFNKDRFIIQRFFLRKDEKVKSEHGDTLALACEAGWYTLNSKIIYKNPDQKQLFGKSNGEVIIRNVDHFHYLLEIADVTTNTQARYISIEDYKKINAFPRPRVNAVQLGLLMHSGETIGRSNLKKHAQNFEILDQKVHLKSSQTHTSTPYLYQVLIQTVALRNGLHLIDISESEL